jgi:hypothetical protein
MRSTRLLFALVFALASLLGAPSVRAESGMLPDLGPPCTVAGLETDPLAGDVPANWPIFTFVGADGRRLDWSTVKLVRVSDGVDVLLATPYVAPLANLVVGEDYDLYHPICPGETPSITRYRAVAPIAEPSSLGTISVSELYASNYEQGVGNRNYFVEVRLDPDPGLALEPWVRTISWDREIDGDGSAPSAWPLNVPLRVPVDCGAGYGIAPGDHVFRGVGFVVPGVERVATPVVASTIGACATALRVDNTTLRPLTPEEIAYWDLEPRDGGVSWMDGGMDGGVDGGRMGTFTARDTNSNCTIGVGRRASFGPWALVAIAAFIVSRRSRRKAGSRVTSGRDPTVVGFGAAACT